VSYSTFDEINDYTGFAKGDKFKNADEVRAYFSLQAQREMFGDDAFENAETLRQWAELVIENGWHMTG
jgi:hypothetical protein